MRFTWLTDSDVESAKLPSRFCAFGDREPQKRGDGCLMPTEDFKHLCMIESIATPEHPNSQLTPSVIALKSIHRGTRRDSTPSNHGYADAFGGTAS